MQPPVRRGNLAVGRPNRYGGGVVRPLVGSRHVGDVLSLVRQGFRLGVEFGTQSIEALLWVAETVEEGVYESHSLRRTEDGLEFALDNPPLRVGAFESLSVRVDGTVLDPARVRFRAAPGAPWRLGSSITPATPWCLAPGDRTEFRLEGEIGSSGEETTVRLELRTAAVPPLVWLEFTDRPEEEALQP